MTKDISLLLSRWSGGLGRPLTGNYVGMPESLELRGSRLVYSAAGRLKRVAPEHLLDDFLKLADQFADSRDILTFARRYGPLYLCEHHGIAAYHKPVLMTFSPLGPTPIFGIDEPFKFAWCAPRLERRSPETFSEPVEAWFSLARRAANLLRVSNAVRLYGNAPVELWEKADGFAGSFGQRFGRSWVYLDNPWHRLAANLNNWIISADVCLRVLVERESLVASLGAPFTFSSFALVAIQLLLAVLRSEGLGVLLRLRHSVHLQSSAIGRQVRRATNCEAKLLSELP